MIGRYLLISGIPVTTINIIKEVNTLIQYLISKTEESPHFTLYSTILASQDPSWTKFEFVTKKVGHEGPTKFECLGYYNERFELSKKNVIIQY